jgi:Pentapeptide repeats (8 copies)
LRVLKRWAAWPQGIRWLAGAITAAVLAVVVAWVLFVPAADWLATHDVGHVTGALRQTARDAARGRLLTLGAGLFAAGALLFTARNFTLSREWQVTDRYTKAIEQLGSDKLDVRIGGIYALERIARDSARDHPTVMEVLAAFIREHSREQWPAPEPATDARPPRIPDPGDPPRRTTRPDVQAAVTVIGRRISRNDRETIDLTGADLTGAVLTKANLGGADLTGAVLTGAVLTDANLTGAVLTGAHLTDTYLYRANLTRTGLYGADLTRARLGAAVLTDANLARANLGAADLIGPELSAADMARAGLIDTGFANITAVGLRDADLGRAYLTGADLTGARWPADTPVPKGWKLDTGSGRLVEARIESGPTEAN